MGLRKVRQIVQKKGPQMDDFGDEIIVDSECEEDGEFEGMCRMAERTAATAPNTSARTLFSEAEFLDSRKNTGKRPSDVEGVHGTGRKEAARPAANDISTSRSEGKSQSAAPDSSVSARPALGVSSISDEKKAFLRRGRAPYWREQIN